MCDCTAADGVSVHRRYDLRTKSGQAKVHMSDNAHSGPSDRSGSLCVCSDTYKIRANIGPDWRDHANAGTDEVILITILQKVNT